MGNEIKAITVNIRQYANAFNKSAIESKAVANRLANLGVRSNVTPNVIKKLTKDMMFNNSGKLTKEGREEIAYGLRESGLPKNATLKEYMKAVKNRFEDLAEALAHCKPAEKY